MVLGKKLDLPFPYVLRHSYEKRRLENNGKSRDGLLLLQPAKNEKATRFFFDHDEVGATDGGHASDGDVVEGDPAGPQLGKDDDEERDIPWDE